MNSRFSPVTLIARESLRLLGIGLVKRKSNPKFAPLSVIMGGGEGSCSVQKDTDTGHIVRVTLGDDMVNHCLSGSIQVGILDDKGVRVLAAPYSFRSDAVFSLGDASRIFIGPAVDDLIDRIAPLRPDLPPMRADFSYQSGV